MRFNLLLFNIYMEPIIVVTILLVLISAPKIAAYVFLHFFPPMQVAAHIQKEYAAFKAMEQKEQNKYSSRRLMRMFRNIPFLQQRLYSVIERKWLKETRIYDYQDQINELTTIWKDIHCQLQARHVF